MRIFKDTFWHKYQHLLSMFIPLIASVILMVLACLNLTSSIWFDEAYSAYLVRGDFGQIWSMTAMDVHPPFYYFCLKVWTLLFGTSDFAMRFMSVFFAAVALVFAFQLIKRWFGIKAATFSTLLMSLSPMLIRYSQEMRMYTLVLAIVMAATYVLTLALDHPNKRSSWIIYGLLICLGMWTQYFSALVWLLHLGYIIYRLGGFKKFWQHKYIIQAYLLAILLYLPWLPSFIHQFLDVQSGFWISSPTLSTPVDYLSTSLIYQETSAEVNAWCGLLVILTTVALGVALKRHYHRLSHDARRRFLLILGLAIIPPLLLLAISMPPLQAYFVPRYVLYSAVALWLLAGIFLASAPRIPFLKSQRCSLTPILAGLMLVSAVVGAVSVTTRQPNGFVKDIVMPVHQLSSAGEPILAATDFTYYDAVFYDSPDHPVYFANDWTDYRWGSLAPIKSYHYHVIDDLPQFLAEQDRLWYITDYSADAAQHLPAHLAEHYRVINEISNEHHTALELERIAETSPNHI